MSRIVLNTQDYRDRVYACWLGKNIGGTLGAPHECKRYALGLEFYEPLPDKAAANDDLDLQLVWLQHPHKRRVVFPGYQSKTVNRRNGP